MTVGENLKRYSGEKERYTYPKQHPSRIARADSPFGDHHLGVTVTFGDDEFVNDDAITDKDDGAGQIGLEHRVSHEPGITHTIVKVTAEHSGKALLKSHRGEVDHVNSNQDDDQNNKGLDRITSTTPLPGPERGTHTDSPLYRHQGKGHGREVRGEKGEEHVDTAGVDVEGADVNGARDMEDPGP